MGKFLLRQGDLAQKRAKLEGKNLSSQFEKKVIFRENSSLRETKKKEKKIEKMSGSEDEEYEVEDIVDYRSEGKGKFRLKF